MTATQTPDRYLVAIVDHAGDNDGWLGEDGHHTYIEWNAARFPTEGTAELAADRNRRNLRRLTTRIEAIR